MEDSVKSYGSSYNIVDYIEAHIIFYPKAQIKKMYGFKEGTEKVPCLKPYLILCFQFLLHYNLVCEQPASVHCGLALYADITCVLRSLP